MKDERKTKQELIRELAELRRPPAGESRQSPAWKYLDVAAVIMVALDEQGRITLINQKGCQVLGCREQDLLGLNWFETCVPGPRRERVREVFGRLMKGEIAPVEYFENPVLTRSGEERIISWRNALLTDEQGRITGTLSSGEDVTEKRLAQEAAREAEERYKSIFDRSLFLVYVYDLDGYIIDANEAALKLLGYTREEMLSLNITDLVHPEQVPLALEKTAEVKRQGAIKQPIEIRIKRKDGSFVWLETEGSLLFRQGKPFAVQGIGRDVTERKRAEESLRESESRLHAAIESLPFDFFMLGPDGRYIMANSVCRSRYQDLIGKRPEELAVDEATRDLWLDNNRRAFAGEVVAGEVSFTVKGESGFYYNIIAPVYQEGMVREILGVNIDITDRKLAEDALAAEKERLSVTLRSIGDGVITTDVSGRVVLINRVAEGLTGWKQEEAVGRPFHEIFHLIDERTREEHDDPVRKIIAGGVAVELEGQGVLVARDGAERLIADSGAPIKDRESRIIGAVLVFRDITEKRRMEEELAKADKLESIGILAGGIAHDFNNILTAVLGNISFARTTIAPEGKASELLSEAEKACFRAKDLTQQLLTFAKGGAPLKTPASIAELIRETAAFALGGSRVNCRFDFDPDLAPVEVDHAQISQVINNLVINADQAMPRGGNISIRAENLRVEKDRPELFPPLQPGRYVKITVSDQGVGIPEEHLGKIFDPFYTTKQKGSGLGLAITYSIVKKHDGHITVESKVGAGTAFHVYLPASAKPVPRQEAPGEQGLLGKGKVLLMDDEEAIRELAGTSLAEMGYEVELARDGEEALALYAKAREQGRPFQAVILDLTVRGGMGGKETIIKLLEMDPAATAIVTSGYSTDDVMADFRAYGFKGMLAKPFKLAELNRLLSRLIAGADLGAIPT
jgi:PAS domain S-box-containing protein